MISSFDVLQSSEPKTILTKYPIALDFSFFSPNFHTCFAHLFLHVFCFCVFLGIFEDLTFTKSFQQSTWLSLQRNVSFAHAHFPGLCGLELSCTITMTHITGTSGSKWLGECTLKWRERPDGELKSTPEEGGPRCAVGILQSKGHAAYYEKLRHGGC